MQRINCNKVITYILISCVFVFSLLLNFISSALNFVCYCLGFLAAGLLVYGLFLNIQYIADFFGGGFIGWLVSVVITLCFNIITLLVSSLHSWLAKGYEEPVAYLVMWPLIITLISLFIHKVAEEIKTLAECDIKIADKIKNRFDWN